MSDTVGLNAELQLSIDHALSSIDQLEAALNKATSGVPVELDFLPSVTEFSDAMAQAVAGIAAEPLDIPVTADTTGAEQLILDLGNQPPVDVPVDADTAPAEAAIANLPSIVPAIDIPVEADTTAANEQIADLGNTATAASDGVAGLQGSVTGLGAVVGVTEGSVKELVSGIGELGGESTAVAAGGVLALGAATAGFFEEGLNAVSAAQRFDLVLGDMGNKIKEINVNGLTTSVEDLGIKFGSTASEMENVNSKLFQNAINAGISKDKAVEFAQQIETLSARAISLNPQLGTLADVSSNLGDKLARGGRFAALYGIQLTAGEIATRALSDTGKKAAADLTIVEKSIAGAELASEKYGKTLAGTVAEGQKNAAVQAESLKASFKEAIEQIGVPIVAPVLDLIREAEPDAVLIAKSLGELGRDVIPVLTGALTIISPILQAVAFVLDQIPGPVITGAGAFLGLGVAFQIAGIAATQFGLTLDAAFPELLAFSAAVAVIVAAVSAFSDAGPFVDDVTQAVDTASKGFDDLTVSVHDTVAAEVDAAEKTGDFAKHLNDAGVSSEALTASLIDGGDAFDQYATRIVNAAIVAGLAFDAVRNLGAELEHLRNQTNEAAHSSLDKAVNDGKLSAAARDSAVATAGQIDGQTNYVKALQTVQPEIKATQEATDQRTKADKDAADAVKAHDEALKTIASDFPAVALNMQNVTQTTGDWGFALAGLSLSLQGANLDSKQFDAAAQALGVTSTQLKGFIGEVSKEIQDFTDTALKQLPTVSSAIDAVLNPPAKPPKPIIIDPQQLQDEIDADIAKIDAFNLQLAFLTQNGLNNLAQVAAQRGPEFTNALVTSIQSGGIDVGKSLDGKFAELNQKTRDEKPLLTEAGKGIAVATGDVARDAAAAFGDHFDISGLAHSKVAATNAEVDAWSHTFPNKVGRVGDDSADFFKIGLSPIVSTTNETLTSAEGVFSGHLTSLNDRSAAAVAESAHHGFADGISPIVEGANATLGLVEGVFSAAAIPLSIAAHLAGELVGRDFDNGIATGIHDFIPTITLAVDGAIDAAHTEARVRSRATSPSKLFAEVGRDLIDGLVLGMDEQTHLVTAAAGRTVAAAVPALPSVRMRAAVTAGPTVSVGSSQTGQVASGSAGDGPIVFHIPATEPNATAAAVLQRIAAVRRTHTPRG